MTLVRQRSSRAPDKRESREFRHKRDSSTALRSVVRNDKRKSSFANLSVLRLMRVIAFAGEDAIAVVLGGDLYLAEFPVLGRVGWVVAQAVLLVQLLRDFVERGFQFINAVHFEHASAGGFGQLLQHVVSVLVFLVGMAHAPVIKAPAFPCRLINLQHLAN